MRLKTRVHGILADPSPLQGLGSIASCTVASTLRTKLLVPVLILYRHSVMDMVHSTYFHRPLSFIQLSKTSLTESSKAITHISSLQILHVECKLMTCNDKVMLVRVVTCTNTYGNAYR